MRKLKILCLHGLGGSGRIMKKQMIGIINNHSYNVYDSDNQTIVEQKKTDSNYIFYFINAPFKIVQIDYEQMKLIDRELLLWHPQSVNNYYYWYDLRSGFTDDKYDASIRYLREIIPKYDMIIGFSQGAAMATICLKEKLINDIILICCPFVQMTNFYDSDFNHDYRALHVFGSDDQINKSSLEGNITEFHSMEVHRRLFNMNAFSNKISIFIGDHNIPRIIPFNIPKYKTMKKSQEDSIEMIEEFMKDCYKRITV